MFYSSALNHNGGLNVRSCSFAQEQTYSHICMKNFNLLLFRGSVYRVALIQPKGSSLVVTHRTADVGVTLDIPVPLGQVPADLSINISGNHAATYVVNACVY